MLSADVAQTIVDRTMAVLNVNVNIMDVNGIVIAAGSKERIGSYHSAALQAIQTGKKKTLTAQEAARFSGVKPGITLPIRYKDSIVGALGMTGDPDVVEKYGELVSLTALLIIEQAELKEQMFLEQRVYETVLLDLFTGRAGDSEELFLQRAKMMRFSMSGRWMVMAASGMPNQGSLTALHYQGLKDRTEARLNQGNLSGLHACFVDDTLAILYRIPDAWPLSREKQMSLGGAVMDLFSPELTAPKICIGPICESWRDIPKAFSEAKGTLHLSKCFSPDEPVFFAERYCMETALAAVPEQRQEEILRTVLGSLTNNGKVQSKVLIETLETYFKNEMNAQLSAQELFIHRNTLNIRLHKIEELTGYSPLKFSEAFVLKAALTLLQLREIR